MLLGWKRLIAALFLCALSAARLAHGGTGDYLALIKDAGSNRVAVGFIVEVGGSSYVYTTQSAIYGMSVVTVVDANGKSLATNEGRFEISADGDLARVPLTDKAPGLKPAPRGSICFGADAVIVDPASSGNIKETAAVISGIGAGTFVMESTEDDSDTLPNPGAPVVLENGTVIGVVGAPIPRFDIQTGWKDKISLASRSEIVAARLDSLANWISSDDAAFAKVSAPLRNAARLSPEIIPLLNWWCEDPYRVAPSDLPLPDTWKSWVANNNKRSGQMEKLVAKVSSAPAGRRGLVKSLRTAMLYRAKRLVLLPSSVRASFNRKSKTWFIRSRLAIAKREWENILDMLYCRIKSLNYSVPGHFSENATPEIPEAKPAEFAAPLADAKLLKSLVAVESLEGADNGVAVVAATSDGSPYAVFAVSMLSKKLYYFRLRSLATGRKIKVEKVELSPEGDVLRMKIAADGKSGLEPLAVENGDTTENATSYLADRELGVARAYSMDIGGTTHLPKRSSPGGPVFSDDGKLVGVASIMETAEPIGAPNLALSKFSMDAAWKPVAYQQLAKTVDSLKSVAGDTASLEALESVFDAFNIIEIYPLYSKKHRKFIEDHGKLLLPTQTRSGGGDNMYRFKLLCSCFSGWKSIRAWARSNLAVLRTAKRRSAYFGKWAEALEKRNAGIVATAEKKMDELVKQHPAIKDKLL